MRTDQPPAFDYLTAGPERAGSRPRLRSSFTVVASCLWGPFGWLLIPAAIPVPWNRTHLQWIALWPVLPGIVPAFVCRGASEWVAVVVSGVFTLALLLGLVWLARGSRSRLLAAGGVALLVSVPTSAVAYAEFRW